MKVFVISIVAITLFFVSFAAVAQITTNKIKFYDDSDLMEQEILRFIPIGSSIEQAKKIMEQNRFKCEYMENSTFSRVRYDENAPGRIRQTVYPNVDFLYCDISKGFLIVERRWQSCIAYEDKKVTMVSVFTGLTGP